MKKILLLLFLLCGLQSLAQNQITLFAKNRLPVTNEEDAVEKIERHDLSGKKFELVQYIKVRGQWQPVPVKSVVSVKKNNRYSVDVIIKGQSYEKKMLEITDTTDTGFIIREFKNGFCIREAEVSSVFPIVYDGARKDFSKDKNGEPKISYFHKNFRFDAVKQPDIPEANVPKNQAHFLPKYPGGIKQFLNDLLDETAFPPDITKEDLEASFLLHLTIDSLGRITNPHFLEAGKPQISQALLKGCHQITKPWKPAVYNRLNSNYTYLIPIMFSAKEKPDSDQILMVADQMPEYPGGEKQLRWDIARNIRYPAEAQKQGIQGKVFVNFIVDIEGNVSRIRVAKGVHPLLDNEAKRVVGKLGRWVPGVHQGEKVRVSYTVPINFILRKSNSGNTTINFEEF